MTLSTVWLVEPYMDTESKQRRHQSDASKHKKAQQAIREEKAPQQSNATDNSQQKGSMATPQRQKTPPTTNGPAASNGSSIPPQTADAWKAVGAPRRASHAVTQTQPGYFLNRPGNQVSEQPGLAAISESRSPPSPEVINALANEPPRVYEFFGGRNHGARSLSFSVGQPADDMLAALTPPPGLSPTTADGDGQMAARMGQLTLGQLNGNGIWGTSGPNPAQPVMPMQSNDQPLLPPERRQELLHRRTSTYSGQVKPVWNQSQPSDLFLAEMSRSQMSPSTASPRRFSFAPGFIPPYDSNDIATRYFTRDPALLERYHFCVECIYSHRYHSRHSLAAAMALTSPGAVENGAQLADFAEQYGNLIDDANAVPVSAPSAPSPRAPQATDKFKEKVDEDVRVRSWSEPNKGLRPKRGDKSAASQLFVVEFKGGRNDVFYIPDDSDLAVRKGNLVIVEADRGKDLGKIVRTNLKREDLMDPSSGKEMQPKMIYRHAQPPEVNMLLDKARDEAKALSICRAKCKQKNLDMEVVDAEFQWDRKKLTFFFLAEQRIDFRDLVKDLFKIYKTRIWMCAVERNRTNTHLRAYDDDEEAAEANGH